MAKKIAENEFEKGFIGVKEKENIFEKNTIARETIQRKLKEMVNEGLINKDNGMYSLSEVALSDLRYFNPDSGSHFGNLLLNELLKLHYPTIDDFQTNIKKLVEILGFYMLYLLTESCKPINYQNKDKYIENKTKDIITQRWFEKALNHQNLLNAFISSVTNQYNEEQRKEYFEKHHKIIDENHGYFEYIKVDDLNENEIKNQELIHILDPMSSSDFTLKRFYALSSKEEYKKYRTTSNPLYEIKQHTIDQIQNILIDSFPDYYKLASFTKLRYENPKEESMNSL